MTRHWNDNEARCLKARGLGFAEIGSAFGVSYYVARSKLDPAWLEKRRAQINANRETVHSLGKRDHVRHIEPEEPRTAEETDTGPFMTASGILAIREQKPRIIVRGLNHRTVTTRVSLPFVSIQRGEG